MKSSAKYFFLLVLAFSLFFWGCQKPGPIELQDTQQSQVADVQPLVADTNFEDQPDTTGLIAGDQSVYFGQLVVSGVRFDAINESHTLSLARAVFRDKSQPIIRNGRTVDYRALDIGSVFIDGLPLYKIQRRIRFTTGGGTIDTLAGVYYILVNKGGIGGRGFSYTPSHLYEWTNSQTSGIDLNITALSARGLRILRPTPQDTILQHQRMPVEWSGGEDVLYLIISVPQLNRQTAPILRMRLQGSQKRVMIPAKVLQLLPVDRSSKFLFTFVSQTRLEAQVAGFPDKILVHSASIHNILLTIQR